MSQMFDPADFASPADSGREPRARRGSKSRWFTQHQKSQGAEPSDGRWVVITTTQGPLDYAHLVAEMTDEQRQRMMGSVMTKCNAVGRVLHQPEPGVHLMLCDVCKADDGQ